MTAQLLRDVIEIPESVHAGDFVLTLSKGVGEDSTITDYVVTDQLADCFDQALELIQSAVERRTSRAAYLDGSFGSGKSHFMAVLHAILRGDPEARGKKGLVPVVAKHDSWLAGRKFFLVPYHMIEASSLESAILGGYVAHVRKEHPGKPLPAVYRDDHMIADARDLRSRMGDDQFIAGLPSSVDDEWGEFGWTPATLDAAMDAPPEHPERKRLVGDLLATYFKRYSDAVSGRSEAFIELDTGLSEISRHAKEVLGYDAVVLLLDELVLWLSSYVGDPIRIKTEAQKVSKLVESAEHDRPAPIVSFIPRQRDLRELVGQDTAGATTASLFDTLKYWDGRFDRIKLEDRNLPVIVEARLLRPRSPEARGVLDAAFQQTTRTRPEIWETLLDAQGGGGGKEGHEAFRRTYPFSPAFLNAMVDISGALQRQRTALKLMQQLLVDYRDMLPVGQLMPLGSIYDVLISGGDRPFTDKLREEFAQAQHFYTNRLRPYLLNKHRLSPEEAQNLPIRHPFRADDLIVKTLLLSALVPNVPALRNLTASRLAALNHGSVVSMIPGQDRVMVARTLRELAGEFGEIRLSGGDDPTVELALIGVDTAAILSQVVNVDDDAARRRLIKSLLWQEFGVKESGEFVDTRQIVWRGTDRVVELVFGNVRDRETLSDDQFSPSDPGALRVIVDYPFDDGNHSPADDRNRIRELQDRLDRPLTLAWLPSFLSMDRIGELRDLVLINHVLEQRDRLGELTPLLTEQDREHARTQLRNRQAALTTKLVDALRRAYGIASPDDADLGARSEEQVMALDSRLELRPPAGLQFADALQRLCGQLLDHAYPKHPDFDPQGKKQVIKKAELVTVLQTVEEAVKDRVGRYEAPRSDLAVLRRIAHPLEIATVGEVVVLRSDWRNLIDAQAAREGSADELRVGQIRRWIAEEQPGLPELVIDLLVACYAVQSDRAWMRAGRAIDPPDIGRIHPDMVLRRQELPSEEEFERAADRALRVFGLERQPTRSARTVNALASALRTRINESLLSVEALASMLKGHCGTLGLDDESPRMVTARTAANALNRLAGITDSTELVRALASVDLPREGEIYQAHLRTAQALRTHLSQLRWPILDQLVELAASRGPQAAPAQGILDGLRAAARLDELQVSLKKPLEDAERAAIELVLQRPDPVPPPITRPDPPKPQPGDETDPTVTRQIDTVDIETLITELRQAVKENPGRYEITWRRIGS
ncbi:phage resistance protein [Thermomonospora amylolytica]|uniref:phage resistance protein n=1 Tax=Thermomonospora amylolytica TaxID=1411117 RepID=UPI000E6B8826|nr:phage resistance protein [Thermomonospora amylolytica]